MDRIPLGQYKSEECDVISGITKASDVNLRWALYQAAMFALARHIGVVLHRIWRDGTEFNQVTHQSPEVFRPQ